MVKIYAPVVATVQGGKRGDAAIVAAIVAVAVAVVVRQWRWRRSAKR